jgi:hypothetical protein
MTLPGPVNPSQARVYQTHRPPPTELLALAYYGPLVAPTPVATRVPQPSATADTINGFLRVEAGGGTLRLDTILWDVSVILHAYAPNTEEAMAEQLIEEAVAWGANAQGTTTFMDNGDAWYITYSRCTSFAIRKADPYVNLTRYRAAVTWRVPGIPIVPGQRFRRIVPPPPPEQQAAEPTQAPKPSRRR